MSLKQCKKSSIRSKLFGFLKMSRNFLFPNCRVFHLANGDAIAPNSISGLACLKDARLNKGLAFTYEERQHLSIQGLQPPSVRQLEEQIKICYHTMKHYKDPISRYLYLAELRERNQTLFNKLVRDYAKETLPLVYTPTVGYACRLSGSLYRGPNGLYITYHDKGHVRQIVQNWPEAKVRAVCFTDGERILGLGDLGCNGMGIPIGKLALYTIFGGVPPHYLLPVMIDVGTNNEALLKDPFYIGIRMKRVTGSCYLEFLDEIMEAITEAYGPTTLLHFEDFAFGNALKLLNRYQCRYCCYNDDVQGTGSVGLAGVLAACKILKKPVKDLKFLFAGAGGANLGICLMILNHLQNENVPLEKALEKFFFTDVDGLLTKDRQNLPAALQPFAKDMKPTKDLLEVVKQVKPNVLFGATAQGGLFTPEILQTMAEINEKPVIFALSNPTIKSECTAEQAFTHTKGKVIFASGSPMPPVQYEGKTFTPAQANNVYIFPGVALGLIFAQARHCFDDVFVIAAEALAENISQESLNQGSVFPPSDQIFECSIKIAVKVIEHIYCLGLAGLYPKPQNIEEALRKQLYNFQYEKVVPATWTWPCMPVVPFKDEHFKSSPLDVDRK